MKLVLCVLATLVAMVIAGGKHHGDHGHEHSHGKRGHHGKGYDASPYDPNDQKGLVPRYLL